MPPKIISKDQYRDYMLRAVAATKITFDEKPIKPITPELIVIHDIMQEEHEPGQGKYAVEFVTLHGFDENRYALMEINGQKFAREQKLIVMAILISEAWMVTKPIEKYKADPTPPSKDPNRQDIVMVCGMTVDLHAEMMRAYITRDKQGRGSLGRFVRMTGHKDFLLGKFFVSYAVAFAGAES